MFVPSVPCDDSLPSAGLQNGDLLLSIFRGGWEIVEARRALEMVGKSDEGTPSMQSTCSPHVVFPRHASSSRLCSLCRRRHLIILFLPLVLLFYLMLGDQVILGMYLCELMYSLMTVMMNRQRCRISHPRLPNASFWLRAFTIEPLSVG